MQTPSPTTILFDWDGTIVDSIDDLFEAYALVSGRFELPFDRTVFRRVFSPNWRLMYRTMGIPEDRIDEAGDMWVEAFAGSGVRLFPGIREGLEQLHDAGCTLGLVTGGYHDVIAPQIERFGLGDLLPVRVYGDETAEGKPDPAPLRLALERAGAHVAGNGRRGAAVAPEAAIYLGDAPDDVRMAAAAGVHGVGIVSVIATAAELEAAGANETAASSVEWIVRFLGARGPA